MMSHGSPRIRRLSAAVILLSLVAACGRDESAASDSAAGVTANDTGSVTSTLTPAAPAPPPTAEDAGVVRDAMEFKLTNDNLNKFMKAGGSLAFLRARDSQVRAYLESIGGSRASNDDSALERIEAHPQISKAIADAGLSPRDYYTMSIAIASARRFVDEPNAAPPTPTLRENAEFLRENRQHLAHLRVWGQ